MSKGVKGYGVSVIANINKDFLDKWEGFPGPNFLKFFFVILGLFCWLEVIIPGFNPISLFLIPLFKTGNTLMWLLSFIILMGCLACMFFWFPTYLWSVIKNLK